MRLSYFIAMSGMCLVSAATFSSDYYRANETINLTIHHHQDKFVYDDQWPVEKEAFHMTNVSLQNVTIIGGNDSAKAFQILMESSDLPDIVGGMNIKSNVNQFGPQGAFLALDDLINTHAPNIRAFLLRNPNLKRSIVASDGKLYFIPFFPDGKYARGYFIRYDWLQALDLDVPQTVEELYTVLKAFKTQDPNGNGKADEVPFFARQPEELVRLVTLWDGRTTGSGAYHDFYIDNGNVTHGYAETNFMQGIKNLAKWYKEGLIDSEIFSRGNSARDELLNSNRGGVTRDWFASTSSYNDTLSSKIDGFEFKAFAPPASVSGKQVEEDRRSPVLPEGWAISYSNSFPVETIKYFDFWFTEQGQRLANFGVEGVHYDLINGVPQFKPEVLNNKVPVSVQMRAIGAQISRGVPQDYEYEKQWTNRHALEGISAYDNGDYLLEPFLGVTLSETEKAKYDQLWPSILSYMQQMQKSWITGERKVEQDWENYIKVLDQLGYPRVIEAMQDAYDRQYK